MYWQDENGRQYGVLNDFDLAVWLDKDLRGPQSSQRTGTLPYMAMDLLHHPPRP